MTWTETVLLLIGCAAVLAVLCPNANAPTSTRLRPTRDLRHHLHRQRCDIKNSDKPGITCAPAMINMEYKMNWNLSPEVQNNLESVARDEALLSQEHHAYLPKTPDEAATFNPHEWVLEAMRRAYVMGRTAGAMKARQEIRAALGVVQG